MQNSSKASTNMINATAMVFTNGQMVISMKASSRMI